MGPGILREHASCRWRARGVPRSERRFSRILFWHGSSVNEYKLGNVSTVFPFSHYGTRLHRRLQTSLFNWGYTQADPNCWFWDWRIGEGIRDGQ